MIISVNISKRSISNFEKVIMEVENLEKGWVDINLEMMLRKKG